MEHFRPLRQGHVRYLFNLLKQGKNFKGVFVLNGIEDKRASGGWRYVLIDGNHRWEAVILFFEAFPNATVWIDVHLYKNLPVEQEREVYNEYAHVIVQRESDKVFINQEDIPIWAMMQRDFPAPVKLSSSGASTNKGSLGFLSLTKAYMARYTSNAFHGHDIVEQLKRLDRDDCRAIREFAEVVVTVFGKPMPGNIYTKMVPLTSLAKVYFCNLKRLGREEIVRRLKEKVLQDPIVMNDIAIHSRALGNVKSLTETIVNVANKGYSAPERLFITPEQFQRTIIATNGNGTHPV